MWCKILVISVFLNIGTDLVLAHKAKSGNVKPKINEEKLKEIAAIRENLNKAFEEDAEKQTSAKGVIVQPEWTQGGNNRNAATAVVVTQENLKESAAIREEIQTAVKTGKYAKGESEVNTSQADHYLGLKFRSKNVLSNMVGSEKDKFDTEVVGNTFDEETDTKLPNVIESIALDDDIDIEKLKQLETSSRRTREILVVKEIIEDLSFELGKDVKAWKHLEYDGREYYIGLRDNDLLVVQKDAMKYEKGDSYQVGSPISHLETFNYWNTDSEKQEGIIIIATNEKLIWYQVHSADVLWEWFIGVPITVLLHFKIGNVEYVAISSNQGLSSLSIYQFDLRSKESWLAQKFQLEAECVDIAFLDTGRDTVLTIVQNNSASIFTFNPYSEESAHIKFQLKNTIESEGIQSVSGFRMGGYSYLAIGGLSPKILHYSQGEFVPKTILGQNFGLVEMFLPVPARTYRDDMFLLVQHRVDFESHALIVLDTLIWDGEVFDTIAPAPCIIGNYTFLHGISCLLDVQRETGIKGSAILKKDDHIFILVPRDQAESGLFQIKTELFAKNSELMDLKEIFSFLKEWVNEHDELINEALHFLENDGRLSSTQSDISSNSSTLRAPELYFDGDIGQIYLNEHKWTDEDTRVDVEDLVGEIERLDISLGNGGDIIRHRRELTYDTLNFENMETEELEYQHWNGEKSYIKNSELITNITVSFDALWVIDEIRLSSARSIRDTVTQMNEDLEFEEINGIKWGDFTKDIVLRNKLLEIEELNLVGEIVSEGNTNVSNINGLMFPNHFLWSSGLQISTVQAEKHFLSTLTSHVMDTNGTLNEVNPFHVISLSEEQNISGLTTFTQLEVSERMHVNGTVQGKGLTEFLSNPSLLDSNIIHSACTFHHLEVSGPILIAEKYNGINMDEQLNDIVYHKTITSAGVLIPSAKRFTSIEFHEPLKLENGDLNQIPLNIFVTRNTIQNLDIRNISGNVYFNNISIDGQYDSVDIKALMADSIHADSDVAANAHIRFNESCWAKSIQISETLNGVNNYIQLQEDIRIEKVEFATVFANSLITECDIIGMGTLNTDKLQPRTENRDLKVYVGELILRSGLQTRMLNNFPSQSIIPFLEHVDDIPTMIWEGKIIVHQIHTDGDVHVMKLNNQNFDDEIQMFTVWLNRPNYLQTNLIFEKAINMDGHLSLFGTLNGHNFSNILQDTVFKTEPVILKTDKHFLQIVNVMENSQIEKVNKVPFIDIATKQTVERFRGNVYVNNALSTNNIYIPQIVDGQLNNFGKFFRFDEKSNTLVLLDEIKFKSDFNVESLHIHGKLNSIGNVNEFFENLVYKNTICMLKGKTTFKNGVIVEKGAYIRNLNGFNMAHLIKNVVFINHPDPVKISASVIFKEPVRVKDLTIKTSLVTSNLGSCLLRDWMEDTLRVDKSLDIDGALQFGQGVINQNYIHAVYINDLDLDYVVPLNTLQNISGYMNFSHIYLSDSIESELVNGMSLAAEMENTLRVDENAHITTPLIVNSCDVVRSLDATNMADSLDKLHGIVNINEDLEINFPIFFHKINTSQVNTSSSITGIDFHQWHQNSLLPKFRQNTVTGNWSTRIFKAGAANVDKYIENTDKQKQLRQKQNKELNQSFTKLCQKSNQLVHSTGKRVSFVKRIEKSFSMIENEDIKKVFFAEDPNRSYLLINIKCQTKIFAWNAKDEEFMVLSQFNSGVVDEILMFPGQNETFYLVTKVEKPLDECDHVGLNTWFFDRQKMTHLKSFGHADISMIHPSFKNTNAFYAISEGMRQILQLTANSSEEHAWDLPVSGSESYRFLPHDADLGVALSNGHHILLLNQPPTHQVQRKRRRSIKFEENITSAETNSFIGAKKLNYLELLQGLEKKLLDLMLSLNMQLLDVESIMAGESGKNEYNYNEFIYFIKELNKTESLSAEFTGLSFDEPKFSHNPTMIFIGRIVQIIWPVIRQITAVQANFHSPEAEYKICGQIWRMLNSAMNDILQVEKDSLETVLESNTPTYVAKTISRVKKLQTGISDLIYKVKALLQKTKPLETDQAMASELSMQYLQLSTNVTTPNPLEEPFIGQSILENNFLVANSPHLPVRGEGEIISIRTGISGQTRSLIATTETQFETEINAIKIYFDVVTGSLFQTLSAHKPSCLSAFRIDNESFLAFVEDEQTIRVLKYTGIRGFVDFLKFKVYLPVLGLNSVSVTAKTNSACLKHFLVVNSRKNIDFYEIFIAGYCSPQISVANCSIFET